jgi:glycosyltransferase involved in cell wall biosynthesis
MEQLFKYKVATQCFTYNHRSYIKDTLDGFVIQQTDFPVVYVVVDDASTDGEPDYLRTWAENNLNLLEEIAYKKQMPYGELIFGAYNAKSNLYFAILLLSENHYQNGRDNQKLQYISEWCDNAEYIAICEGDDYWIDPKKLQMQVEALNRNANINICAHACSIVDAVSHKEIGISQRSKDEKVFSINDVIMEGGGFVITNTLVYRKDAPIYNFFKNYQLDYFCQINYSIDSGLLYLPQIMSVYRDNVPGSICTSMDKDHKKKQEFLEREITTLEAFDVELKQKYSKPIAAYLLKRLITTSNSAKTNKYLFFKYKKGFNLLSCRQKTKVLLCSVCPSFFAK